MCRDRVVKIELLRFLLRGPGTALVTLGIIVATGRADEFLELPAQDFLPFWRDCRSTVLAMDDSSCSTTLSRRVAHLW